MVLNVDFQDIQARDYGFCFLLWVFLYLIRGAMVLLMSPFLYKLGYKALTWKEALIITHGGLRGAVSLALGLAVSLEDGGGADGLPEAVRHRTLFYAGALRMDPACCLPWTQLLCHVMCPVPLCRRHCHPYLADQRHHHPLRHQRPWPHEGASRTATHL